MSDRFPTIEVNRSRSSTIDKKRQYSYSINSITSNEEFEEKKNLNKNRKLSQADLENQLIETAGGSREDVFWFFVKLTILLLLVLGSGVLIFYAL